MELQRDANRSYVQEACSILYVRNCVINSYDVWAVNLAKDAFAPSKGSTEHKC